MTAVAPLAAAADLVMELSDEDIIDTSPLTMSFFDVHSVPRLRGPLDLDGLDAHEAWFVSLVTGNTPLSVILDTSPLADEEIFRIVASLVSKRAIMLFPNP